MTNAGRTTTSGNDTWVVNQGSNNQYGYRISMPETGIVTFLDVYMAGSGGTCRTRLCLWDSSGNLLAQSNQFTAGAGSGGVNGQSFRRQAVITPVLITAGNYYVGFWRNGSDSAEWSYNAGSGTIHPSAPSGGVSNVGSPGSLSLGSTTTGQMSAYLEYNPPGGYVYDGSNYQASPAYAYDGSSWQIMNGVYVYDGSSWQLVN
jgi:hypothetical protein